MLFSHRNPGEDINQAVSVTGQQPYTALPNAFRYRTALDQTLQLQATRRDLVAGLEERRGHHGRARRHRRERSARAADVAAARRRAGQADPARTRRASARRRAGGRAAATGCSARRRPRPTNRPSRPRRRPSPIPTARCARSGRHSFRRALNRSEIERFGLARRAALSSARRAPATARRCRGSD